ncbi:MAG: hypothetical protein WCO56_16440 [Verrucomicrobiota bacterium]
MPKKQSPNSVRIRNSTAEFLTFAYQTGGDGVEVRVQSAIKRRVGPPFQGWWVWFDPVPRALPWADVARPVGAETKIGDQR